MFRDIDDVEEFIETEKELMIDNVHYLNLVFEIMDRKDIELTSSLSNFEALINKIEKNIKITVNELERFRNFIKSWDEEVLEITREGWLEDNEGYENFEKFLDSDAGAAELRMADEAVNDMFNDDDWFPFLVEFINKDLNIRNFEDSTANRIISEIEDGIYDEFSEFEKMYRELPYDIIKESLDDEQVW